MSPSCSINSSALHAVVTPVKTIPKGFSMDLAAAFNPLISNLSMRISSLITRTRLTGFFMPLPQFLIRNALAQRYHGECITDFSKRASFYFQHGMMLHAADCAESEFQVQTVRTFVGVQHAKTQWRIQLARPDNQPGDNRAAYALILVLRTDLNLIQPQTILPGNNDEHTDRFALLHDDFDIFCLPRLQKQ